MGIENEKEVLEMLGVKFTELTEEMKEGIKKDLEKIYDKDNLDAAATNS